MIQVFSIERACGVREDKVSMGLHREYTSMHLAGDSAIDAQVEHAGGRTQRLQLECKAVIVDKITAS